MLLMIEKGTRGGICHAIQQYSKANNKYVKDLPYLKYSDENNSEGWEMSRKLPAIEFK